MTHAPEDGAEAGLRPLADVAADVCDGLVRKIHSAALREAERAHAHAIEKADAVLADQLAAVAALRARMRG